MNDDLLLLDTHRWLWAQLGLLTKDKRLIDYSRQHHLRVLSA